jgi:hypothetical protein
MISMEYKRGEGLTPLHKIRGKMVTVILVLQMMAVMLPLRNVTRANERYVD